MHRSMERILDVGAGCPQLGAVIKAVLHHQCDVGKPKRTFRDSQKPGPQKSPVFECLSDNTGREGLWVERDC